jgi:glycosyltransferase involved in cell wall biosynthesis
VSASPRVLFVSKPIVPPWHDGSKNLVRDIATHLTRARPTVLTTPHSVPVGEGVAEEPVYRAAGTFAPALSANLRVLLRLLNGDPHDIWHFVFAPSAASSTAARLARSVRWARGWRGRTIQTVASAPRRFSDMPRLLFGDRIVVLSEWTRARLIGAGASAQNLRVIPPCARPPTPRTPDAARRVRQRYGIGDGPIVVYPGDYEVSTGALTVARAIGDVIRSVPGARFVFACRAKTRGAEAARKAVVLETSDRELAGRALHVGEIDDLHELLGAASAVAFPVDDLYGKVDVPLVVLESLAIGVPLVLARGGPLEGVGSARFVAASDPGALAVELVKLLTDAGAAGVLAERGRREYEANFSPRVVAAQYDELYAE